VEDFMSLLTDNFRMLHLWDIIDILIVAYVVYKGIKLVIETRAFQLIRGIVILLVATQLSGWLQLNSVNYILVNVMQVGMIALLIVFQPELRRTLEKVGRSKIGSIFSPVDYDIERVVGQVCEASAYMSESRIGALMVIEKETKLSDVGKTGTVINADVSAELLVNIFIPKTPLHDGAVIIGDNKIKSAACILPLTEQNNISRELGTRHRAAIGMSENADCVVVVVSEETGRISMAKNGFLTRNLSRDSLAKELKKAFKDTRTADVSSAKQKIKNWTVKKK